MDPLISILVVAMIVIPCIFAMAILIGKLFLIIYILKAIVRYVKENNEPPVIPQKESL